MKVIEMEFIVEKVVRLVKRWLPLRNAMLPTVIIFVFLVPVVLEYMHDLHAKKNALLKRSAIWEENTEELCLLRWRSSCGVTAF